MVEALEKAEREVPRSLRALAERTAMKDPTERKDFREPRIKN
jgi:hypothetical protein